MVASPENTAITLLLLISGLLLGYRILRRLRHGIGSEADTPTYDDPRLQLEEEEQPHALFGELASTLEADADADDRYLNPKQTSDLLSERFPVAAKVLLAGGLVWLFVVAAYWIPVGRFTPLRVLTTPPRTRTPTPPTELAGGPLPAASVGEGKLPGATFDQQDRAADLEAPVPNARGPIAGSQPAAPLIAAAVDEKKPPRSIEDPSGKALNKFFDKLARVESKEPGAQARILYYGDSIVASDFVTGKLRRLLQNRFGDAGHGYAIIANAWPGWFHIDVSRKASGEWRRSTCVGPYAKDALYGLGCASFVARNPKIWTEFGTAKGKKWGHHVSSFEIEYLKQPGGGAIEILVDGEKQETLETEADTPEVAWHRVDVPDGPHRLKLQTVDKRPVRAFGIRMERETNGVMLSAMGITGARARFLDKQDNAHWAAALKAAKPDLVVLAFGSNEVTDGNLYPMDKYRASLAEVLEQVEKAVPDAAWMLSGPPDMASKNSSQGHSRAMVHYIVKNQKELAAERGWAFWDQYRAMGGAGSMWLWMQSGLGNQDMFHPTGQGGNLLGRWEYLALMEAFEKYKAARR